MTDFFDPAYVQKHYDEMAGWYIKNRHLFNNEPQLEKLAGLIGTGKRILDLGCGNGVPVCRFFAARGHEVTGVDFSATMLASARDQVPQARFLQRNILAIDFASGSFDLITSFYTLFHLLRRDQQVIFRKMYQILKPGGYAYFTLASRGYTGQDEFEGALTFENQRLPYSHYSQARYREILQKLGFTVRSLEDLTIGGETMLWALAQKPAA
jgi:ubiquinone/menaquinone biosynthesis C-methylase UbiE